MLDRIISGVPEPAPETDKNTACLARPWQDDRYLQSNGFEETDEEAKAYLLGVPAIK